MNCWASRTPPVGRPSTGLRQQHASSFFLLIYKFKTVSDLHISLFLSLSHIHPKNKEWFSETTQNRFMLKKRARPLKLSKLRTVPLSARKWHLSLLKCIPTTALMFVLQFPKHRSGPVDEEQKSIASNNSHLSLLAELWLPKGPGETLDLQLFHNLSLDKYSR